MWVHVGLGDYMRRFLLAEGAHVSVQASPCASTTALHLQAGLLPESFTLTACLSVLLLPKSHIVHQQRITHRGYSPCLVEPPHTLQLREQVPTAGWPTAALHSHNHRGLSAPAHSPATGGGAARMGSVRSVRHPHHLPGRRIPSTVRAPGAPLRLGRPRRGRRPVSWGAPPPGRHGRGAQGCRRADGPRQVFIACPALSHSCFHHPGVGDTRQHRLT